jgi:hypothetical protein
MSDLEDRYKKDVDLVCDTLGLSPDMAMQALKYFKWCAVIAAARPSDMDVQCTTPLHQIVQAVQSNSAQANTVPDQQSSLLHAGILCV